MTAYGETGVSGATHGERAEAPRQFKPYPAYKDSGVEWLRRFRRIGR